MTELSHTELIQYYLDNHIPATATDIKADEVDHENGAPLKVDDPNGEQRQPDISFVLNDALYRVEIKTVDDIDNDHTRSQIQAYMNGAFVELAFPEIGFEDAVKVKKDLNLGFQLRAMS